MSIKLTFVYTCKIPQVQKVSAISVWTNYSLPRSVTELPVKFSDIDNIVSVPLEVSVPVTKNTETGKPQLVADAAVMFEVMASVLNEDHVPVRQRSGYAHVPLSDLLNKAVTEYNFEYFNQWDENGQRIGCGNLSLTDVKYVGVEKKEIGFKGDAYSFVDENADYLSKTITCLVARKIVNYTEEAAAKGNGMTPIRSILSLVQDPYYNTTAGVTYGPAYWMLTNLSSNNTAYYNELLEKAQFRHNRDGSWFRSTIDDQFDSIQKRPEYFNNEFNNVVEVICDALCMPSVSLPYISDTVDLNQRKLMPKNKKSEFANYDPALIKPSESWDDAMVRNGGDCEDLARLIHTVFQGLRNGNFVEGSLAAYAQRVLKLYAGCGSLGSVLMPALGNEQETEESANKIAIIDSDEDKRANVGAHMYYILVPIPQFAGLLRKTTTDLPDDLEGPHNQPGWKHLKKALLEGTGRLAPFQTAYSTATTSTKREDQMALVAKENARLKAIVHLVENTKVTSTMQITRGSRFLTPVPNARFGNFYRQATSIVTLEFLDKLNMIQFMWSTLGERVPEAAASTSLTTGAAMESVAAADDACCEEDVWGNLSAQLNVSIATHSAAPSSRAPMSDEQKKRNENFLNGNFATGAASIQKALLREIMRTEATPSPKVGALKIKYGINTEDIFRNDAPHVALLPTTSIDPVEMRVMAGLHRHLRPVSLPGDFSLVERIFEAEDKSLKEIGIDTKRGDDKASEAVAALRKWSHNAMNANAWPSYAEAERQKLSLLTFFFPKTQLRPLKDGSNVFLDQLISEYGSLKNAGVITHCRIGVEAPLPRREHVVLQFMCDSTKIPSKK